MHFRVPPHLWPRCPDRPPHGKDHQFVSAPLASLKGAACPGARASEPSRREHPGDRDLTLTLDGTPSLWHSPRGQRRAVAAGGHREEFLVKRNSTHPKNNWKEGREGERGEKEEEEREGKREEENG